MPTIHYVPQKLAHQEGRVSMAAETKEFKSYLANKCIIGYGIINGIVNAAIFFGMNASNPDVTFAAGKVVEEIVLTRSAGLYPYLALFRSPRWTCARTSTRPTPIATASSPSSPAAPSPCPSPWASSRPWLPAPWPWSSPCSCPCPSPAPA